MQTWMDHIGSSNLNHDVYKSNFHIGLKENQDILSIWYETYKLVGLQFMVEFWGQGSTRNILFSQKWTLLKYCFNLTLILKCQKGPKSIFNANTHLNLSENDFH